MCVQQLQIDGALLLMHLHVRVLIHLKNWGRVSMRPWYNQMSGAANPCRQCLCFVGEITRKLAYWSTDLSPVDSLIVELSFSSP